MPAVHPDLAAGTASFISTSANADLICRREIVGSGNFKSKVNAIYRLNSEVTFVGAETSENTSAVMPSHQPNDLLLVYASGEVSSSPAVPIGQGWQVIKSYGGQPTAFTLAYKFATTNSETVGQWAGSSRTTAVVYRNVRKVPNHSTTTSNFLATNILYPALATENSGGTRVVYFSTTKQNLDSALTPSNTTTRISTQAISGSAPGIGVHDRLLPSGTEFAGGTNVPVVTSNTETQAIAIELLSGVPEIQAASIGFTTGLNGDVFKNRLSPTSRRYNVTLPQVFWTYRSFFTTSTGSFTQSLSPVAAARGSPAPRGPRHTPFGLNEELVVCLFVRLVYQSIG